MDNQIRENNHISIRISSDGFSLYILDSNNTVVLSRTYNIHNPDNLEAEFVTFIDQIYDVNIDSNTVEICFESEFYTIAPKGLFELDHLLSIINFQHIKLPETAFTLHTNEIKTYDVVLAFTINTAIYNIISSKFDSYNIKHHLTSILSEQLTEKDVLKVNVRKNKVDLVLFQNGILKISNSFKYITQEDILYNILNVKESLKLDIDAFLKVVYLDQTNIQLTDTLSKHLKKVEIKTITT